MMDTLEHSKQLMAAGFTQKQAEVQTKLLNEVFVSDFATKKEVKEGFKEMDLRFGEISLQLKEIRQEIADRPLRDMIKLFGFSVALVTLVGGIIVIYQFVTR